MLKSLKRVLLSNRVLSLSGNLLASGFAFISISILTRTITPHDIGVWTLFLTLSGFFDMFRAGILRVGLIRNMFENEKNVIGSSWLLGLMVTLFLTSICLIAYFTIPDILEDYNIVLFAKYYPILAFINLPYFFTFWIQQAKSNFGKILISRMSQTLFFAAFIIYSKIYSTNLNEIAIAYIISFALSSAISLILNWTHLSYIASGSKTTIAKLFKFGRYTVGTALGTNLLKSSDTLIINAFLGPTAVALYSMPYKVMELIEIPVRSIVATVLPKMAKASVEKQSNNLIAKLFYENAGSTIILLIPILVAAAVFPDTIMELFFGEQFKDSGYILRIFCVYGLIIPIDRFIGITLDAIDKPEFNLRKIVYMLIANVSLDIIALKMFDEVAAAAAVTIVTISTGVLFGHIYINKYIRIKFRKILPLGFLYLKKQVKQLL